MIRKMLINAADPEELRVAIVEEGRLEYFFTETAAGEQTRGNVYKGIVVNLEKSLGAAFIDYGDKRHGFLQIQEVNPDLWPLKVQKQKGKPDIKEALQKGQEILVQVVKEKTGNKGASLTTFLSLPGQFLVLTPGREGGGVSLKIADDKERGRLKEIIASLKASMGGGLIARTAAQGRSKREVTGEARVLARMWRDMKKRAQTAKAPSLIHKEQELSVRVVRDWLTTDLQDVLVDDPEACKRVQDFVALVNPRRKGSVKLLQEKRPIFARFQIEEQLSSIYWPEVKLPSGGSIVIHPTEALVAIDVNSGKALGGARLENTALDVNLEAAAEAARQLRLRDLGGLIVIDFIDMREAKNRRKVVAGLKKELKRDKAKTTVGAISRFGLLEMSRQRIRPPADFGATRTCAHCGGTGMTRTPEAAVRRVLHDLSRTIKQAPPEGFRIVAQPEVAHLLLNAKRGELSRLEARSGCCLEVVVDHEVGPEQAIIQTGSCAWALPSPGRGDEAKSSDSSQVQEPAADSAETSTARKTGDAQPKKRPRRRRSGARGRRGGKRPSKSSQGTAGD